MHGFSSSGEFHTFRLPVPDLWLDIFQKMVAAGLNGVRYVRIRTRDGNPVHLRHGFRSIYIHRTSAGSVVG